MNCLSQVSSYTAAILRTTGRSLYAPWKRKSNVHAAVKLISFEPTLSRFRTHLYSSQSKATSSRPRKKKSVMDPPEKDAFYVVRKGNVVGVYKSLADCQAQQGSSICDPPVSVYKGYSMPKKDEQYLASCGLQNALYTISAADMKDELFGKLVDCPGLDPAAAEGETSGKTAAKKRSHQEVESENVEVIGAASVSDTPSRKQAKKKAEVEVPPLGRGCTLQFDGASKGNPGTAGAGAVLRADDGTLICKLREGLGVATNNVAEYRAVILGLKYALEKGFSRIFVQGDSKLVCMQVQGLWQVKNQNLSTLYEEVKKLKDRFVSFKISHVLRELNSEADAQANLAITLADGQVQEECDK
ncbi:PREDICTED: uncharacterized protein LOC101312118 [Fragaria vesca subsp. vesca]|uniref:uncharacterized protein LOC101312118 n=1 Tax=Fragaria vesca subsp. vesca TaxID=101020 RepID=UPI0002C2F441|nr:PREDICTED: uncharacterized protein LOC101312118 [Fragaria vesca subsp. vesca]